MELIWHGHAFFEINCNDRKILVDPFIGGNPACDIDVNSITEAHLVLVSHGHQDHLGEAFEICKKTGAKLVANYEITEEARDFGIEALEPMNIGGGIKTDGFKIRMTEALHSSGPGRGHAAGFVISYNNLAVYHAGDTGLFYGMKLIGELYSPDVALLPIGDRFTMGPREAARAAELIRAQQVIPMHYNTFPPIEQQPEELTALTGSRAEVVILNPGDSHLLKKDND
ncbi:MAG: metal-dependent hydrolase [bacterium]